MSSYGSHHSGHLHPNYPPTAHPNNPPYPTTPQPQPQTYYPTNPPAQHAGYSTSPSSQGGGYFTNPTYSSSPHHQHQMPPQADPPFHRDRRSSSTSSTYSSARPSFPPHQSAPIMIPSSNRPFNGGGYSTSNPTPQYFHPATASWGQQQPQYGRRASHAAHGHEAHGWGDGEERYAGGERRGSEGNGLDEETLRSYERRYAKDRKLERRPTMGDSVMRMVGKLGGVLGGGDRR